MKHLILRKSLLAHMYLRLAVGRTTQLVWKFKKIFKAGKKDSKEKEHENEKEPSIWLHQQKLREAEIKSRDGLTLTGHFLEHPEAERIVLMFHGWRGRWDIDGAALTQGLYEERCSILMVNQRAHETSGGKYIGFGVLERYDCLKWLEYLTENTHKLPIYLSGISMGASTVLMASGLDLPERVKGVIADCGFTTPYEMVSIFAEKFMKLKGSSMVEAVNYLCRKKAGYDLKEYSTLEAMKKCRVPVFFAHGTGDDFVPYEMTVQNYEACVSDKKLFTAEGAAHTGSYLSDPRRYMEELTAFFHWKMA
mgnify:CR=1 FL=1